MDTRARPPPLYKFRAYDTAERKNRVKNTLLKGEIYFPRPPQFNDPFEARPNFVRADPDIPKWRELVRKFALTKLKGSPTKRFEQARIIAEAADPDLVQLRTDQRSMFENEAAIFSMSAVRDDPLLWAHYAADHTGLCIQIDHTRPPFSIAMAVKYSETYPAIEFPRGHDDAETLERCLFTKARSWSYEREYRVCRVEFAPPRSRDLGMRWSGLTATAPVDRFTGITLGVRMPAAHRAELIELAKARSEPLEVWQAGIHETKYEVTFEKVL
jgi:hypothetical protein